MARLVHVKSRKPTDDLEILFPDRRLAIRGSLWTLREYGLIESAQLAPFGEHVAQAFAAGEHAPAADMCHLLAVATGHDLVEVAGLAETDYQKLVRAWIDVNLHIFKPQEEKKGTQGVRWSDLYTTLVAHGHRFEEIGKYTARQVRLLYESTVRRDGKQRAARIGDMTYGMSGGRGTKDRIRERIIYESRNVLHAERADQGAKVPLSFFPDGSDSGQWVTLIYGSDGLRFRTAQAQLNRRMAEEYAPVAEAKQDEEAERIAGDILLEFRAAPSSRAGRSRTSSHRRTCCACCARHR